MNYHYRCGRCGTRCDSARCYMCNSPIYSPAICDPNRNEIVELREMNARLAARVTALENERPKKKLPEKIHGPEYDIRIKVNGAWKYTVSDKDTIEVVRHRLAAQPQDEQVLLTKNKCGWWRG